ncbi:flagellar assembly protein FliH [Lentibacillus sp. CBA3610]|uniref:flagellar assembly protein FliH n=1 Tax=Lentibacillus sp. CBA3610 TaxID=2518176 RepID=UPI001595B1AC|nr:flagellar assembly protein FliH [Lentibacillus sp. CBA3610]
MSNSHSCQPGTAKKKQINIRPINVNRQVESQSAEDKNVTKQQVQSEIDQAYEALQRIKDEQTTLLEQTNAEIEAAKADWEKEKQKYIEEAKDEGYTEGFEQGKQNGLEQYKQLIADAYEVVKAATEDYHSTIEQSEEAILDLAIHTAEKIIHQQLEEHPDRFMTLVKAAIKEVNDKSELAVYLHPANYHFVIRQKDELIHFDDRKLNVSFYASDALNEGSCLIEHPSGQVDASIDSQLQEVREALYEVSMENDS